jgi:hypothetical protein
MTAVQRAARCPLKKRPPDGPPRWGCTLDMCGWDHSHCERCGDELDNQHPNCTNPACVAPKAGQKTPFQRYFEKTYGTSYDGAFNRDERFHMGDLGEAYDAGWLQRASQSAPTDSDVEIWKARAEINGRKAMEWQDKYEATLRAPAGVQVRADGLYFGDHCFLSHDGILKDRGSLVRTRYREWLAATLSARPATQGEKNGN